MRCILLKQISGNDEKLLLQSADVAILLTSTIAKGGIGGEVDGVDPTRNPGKFAAAWASKNYKKGRCTNYITISSLTCHCKKGTAYK